MRRKRRQRFQVTCFCRAYDFPHRITGGRCNGDLWAAAYFERDRSACEFCNANCNGCEVARGQESIKECAAFQEARQRGDDPRPHQINLEPEWPEEAAE